LAFGSSAEKAVLDFVAHDTVGRRKRQRKGNLSMLMLNLIWMQSPGAGASARNYEFRRRMTFA
jgi:hypothetical protein